MHMPVVLSLVLSYCQMLTVLLCIWIHSCSRLCVPHLATMHLLRKVGFPGSVEAAGCTKQACLSCVKALCQPGASFRCCQFVRCCSPALPDVSCQVTTPRDCCQSQEPQALWSPWCAFLLPIVHELDWQCRRATCLSYVAMTGNAALNIFCLVPGASIQACVMCGSTHLTVNPVCI